MPKLTIDRREVEVPPGATILDAAQKLGIDVPTLCHFTGFKPSTSCLCCIVKVRGTGRLVPSCGTPAMEGMEVESETNEVYDIRRTTLELLLSDHVGDCFAPCDFSCPAHMDIPLMLRQINAEELAEAIHTVKRDIALPAILGRVCPKPCEKGCRRRAADGPVAICKLKRYVADVDLAADEPYRPECEPASGRRVAVVGGGPTGLAAAYYLCRKGHHVALFDDRPELGGRLWDESTEDEMPRDVLRAEIAQITRLGVEVHNNTSLGEKLSLKSLREQFDAVLIACGSIEKETAQGWGLEATARGIVVDKQSYETGTPEVFAAGNAIRTKGMVVRSVADGKEAAESIDQFLGRQPVEGVARRFSSRIGKLSEDEMAEFLAGGTDLPHREPVAADGGLSPIESIEQSGRCLHCDCRALGSCKLKYYSDLYEANPNRYKGERARFQQDLRHSRVIYEPGKCINCGLCIDIATAAGEPLGLSFVGRGFDVRVGVPFDESLEKALGKVAAEVVAACPTAALAFKSPGSAKELPILGQ